MRRLTVGLVSLSLVLVALAASSALIRTPKSPEKFFWGLGAQKFGDPRSALAAEQKRLDAQTALVTVSPNPLPGKLLIVIPDRERIRHSSLAGDDGLTEETKEFLVEREHQERWAFARAIVKAHLAQDAEIDERNDVADPAFEGYDYLVWYRIAETTPGVFSLGWRVRKTGGSAQLPAFIGFEGPPDQVLARTVAVMNEKLSLLSGRLILVAPPPVADLSAVSPPAASAALSITFPADWITQHSMRDSRVVGTSPSGDWCLLGTGKGANLGATQDDIDRKLAFLPDVLVAPLLRFVVSESKEEDREIISGGTRLLHSHRVLWIEATLRDRPGWKIRVLAVPAPHTTYLLVCAFHSAVDFEGTRPIFWSIADTFYWGDLARPTK